MDGEVLVGVFEGDVEGDFLWVGFVVGDGCDFFIGEENGERG